MASDTPLLRTALSGAPLTTLREGDKQIQVLARLRADEFAGLSDVDNLYAFSHSGAQKVPVSQVVAKSQPHGPPRRQPAPSRRRPSSSWG